MRTTTRHRHQRPAAARIAAILGLCVPLLLAACARGISVTPPPTPVYAISVRNATDTEVVVSYDDGTASRALGTVLAGRTERFVIAAPASTSIEVLGRAASGATNYGPFRLTLVAGSTVPVTIQ